MAATLEHLYVTYVDAYNGLLKIWGQPNRTCATYVEKQLLQLVPDFQRMAGPSSGSVRQGMICIAKYEDESYYRAKIISEVVNNAVLVFFIDYGNKDRVDLSNIMVINNPGENVIATIAAQAEEYYLANIRAEGGWSPEVLNEIRRGLCYSEHKYRTVCQSGNDKLIQISYRNEDYSSFLIRQDLAKPVSVKEQMILLRGTFKTQNMEQVTFRPATAQQGPPQSGRDTFFIPSNIQLGPGTQERLNQAVPINQPSIHPQPIFTPQHNRSGIVGTERHFNIANIVQKVIAASNSNNNNNNSSSSSTLGNAEPKATPALNTVVIEALANQLKLHLMKDQSAVSSTSGTLGFVTQVLDVKTTHNVYISYIDDGPWSFSVQLVSNEHELNQLMEELAAFNFQPIKLPLILGSPCIAKSRQYDNYCRGVLVNITHSAVKVFFVDFGNTEDLPYNMLFEMPPKFFKFKIMSQKFSLSGLQRVRPTEEIKRAFIDVVENELLILHVTNLEGENLPTCDLYLKDVNIKRILNDKLRQGKTWDPIQFPRPGEIENVLVTSVASAERFYVQLKRFESELNDISTELAKTGVVYDCFEPDEIVPGTMCICFCAEKNKWLRGTVTTADSMSALTVFYVDYGNSEVVDCNVIRKPPMGIVTRIRTQAIQCCLHEFEGEQPTASDQAALKELIFEKQFSLKVVSDEKDYIIVQLFDDGKDISQSFRSSSNEKDTAMNIDSDVASNKSTEKSVQTLRKNGNDKTDSGKSWRAGEGRRDSEKRPARSNDKSTRMWEFKDIGLDGRCDRHDGNRIGRQSAKGRKMESTKPNGNWREADSSGMKYSSFGQAKKTKLGESITERMKRAARENEERGLKMNETLITRFPVKLENIAFHGHEFRKKEIEIGSTADVIITYFVNPSEVYVQLLSCKEDFRKFMAEIHNYYSTKLPLINKPKKGDVVIAKYKQDGVLYRAVVTNNNPITVRYVDFGNEEISEIENLWPMDKKFLELESQCLKCSVADIKPYQSDIWPVPNPSMDKIFEYDSYACTFLEKSNDCYEVNLIVCQTGMDVRELLISSGHAQEIDEELVTTIPVVKREDHVISMNLMPCEIYNVYVTHIVNPMEFYVQIKSNDMKDIEQKIHKCVIHEQYGPNVEINEINEKDLYLVKVESGFWYRAKVKEMRENDVVVRLIDNGTESCVSYDKITEIPDDLVKYSPQAIMCSLFIKEAYLTPELTEKFATCIKKNFAVFIHEVTDQRLKVTLYSLAGEKLDFLECNKKVPTWIRPITYLPIINRKMLVKMCHIKSPKEIYVQLYEDTAEIEELTSLLFTHYSCQDDVEVEGELSEYELYAVKSMSDQYWYRAELLSYDNDSAKMFYIDNGVSEEVPRQNLKKLSPTFYGRNAFAKRVSLNIDYEDNIEKVLVNKIKRLIGGKVCIGSFAKVRSALYADFEVDGFYLSSQLVSDSVKELVVGLFDYNKPKKSEESNKVLISHVNGPGEFWVHEESITCELSIFQSTLQIACSNGIANENIVEGDIVGARFRDNLWYRALVMAVRDDIVTVRFLDYGNILDINKKQNKFILLNEKLRAIPPFVKMCSLKGFWKNEAVPKFAELVMDNESMYTLVEITDVNGKFDLLRNGRSITEQLTEEGYADDSEDIVFISHINGPDDFYLQKVKDRRLFELLITHLEEADTWPKPTKVVVNEVYCAKSLADKKWYRGRVLTGAEGLVVVSFIDRGNFSVVTQVRELPPHLKILRPLAINCSLERHKGLWADAAINYFWKYLKDAHFKVNFVGKGWRVTIVQLFTDRGENLSEILYDVSDRVAAEAMRRYENKETTEVYNAFYYQQHPDQLSSDSDAEECVVGPDGRLTPAADLNLPKRPENNGGFKSFELEKIIISRDMAGMKVENIPIVREVTEAVKYFGFPETRVLIAKPKPPGYHRKGRQKKSVPDSNGDASVSAPDNSSPGAGNANGTGEDVQK